MKTIDEERRYLSPVMIVRNITLRRDILKISDETAEGGDLDDPVESGEGGDW